MAASKDATMAVRKAARMAAYSGEKTADSSAVSTDSRTVATRADHSADYLGYAKAAQKVALTGANSVG
jgi:hypothetical protein